MKNIILSLFSITLAFATTAQKAASVKMVRSDKDKQIDIFIGGKLFTSFLYPDTLEKPVLFPLHAANGTIVTRGFPLKPLPGEPTDHPHHIGVWFDFENVNGLDFWNNSYAIPAEKKHSYGWIKTDKVVESYSMKDGPDMQKAILFYHANWTNWQNEVLLEESTRYEFSGNDHQRIIDRITVLKADQDVLFKDAKDGLLGLRVAHELQIPSAQEQKFTDDKGNVTIVKADPVPNGNYLTSEGKTGDSAWSSRAKWCKMYGKMGTDSISISIIDHPSNPNYPTYWHARGYGLFAANPLGENIFTNGMKTTNLQLKKDGFVTFRYRIIIDNGNTTITPAQLNQQAKQFASIR